MRRRIVVFLASFWLAVAVASAQNPTLPIAADDVTFSIGAQGGGGMMSQDPHDEYCEISAGCRTPRIATTAMPGAAFTRGRVITLVEVNVGRELQVVYPQDPGTIEYSHRETLVTVLTGYTSPRRAYDLQRRRRRLVRRLDGSCRVPAAARFTDVEVREAAVGFAFGGDMVIDAGRRLGIVSPVRLTYARDNNEVWPGRNCFRPASPSSISCIDAPTDRPDAR